MSLAYGDHNHSGHILQRTRERDRNMLCMQFIHQTASRPTNKPISSVSPGTRAEINSNKRGAMGHSRFSAGLVAVKAALRKLVSRPAPMRAESLGGVSGARGQTSTRNEQSLGVGQAPFDARLTAIVQGEEHRNFASDRRSSSTENTSPSVTPTVQPAMEVQNPGKPPLPDNAYVSVYGPKEIAEVLRMPVSSATVQRASEPLYDLY